MTTRPRTYMYLLADPLHLLRRPLALLVTAVGGLILAAALVLLHGHAAQSAGSCGNGTLDPGEQCDDGNSNNNDTCIITNPGGAPGPANCVLATCGDGFQCTAAACTTGPGGGPEQCDDANTVNNDGCTRCGIDPPTGLQFLTSSLQSRGLSGPDSVAASPDGAHVYVASRFSNAVAAFARNPATGALTFAQAQFDGVGGVTGLAGAASVTVSPDGAHVYVAGVGTVAVFARNATTGQLTFVEVQQQGSGTVDGLGGAKSVTVSPDGAHVYVAAGSSSLTGTVVVFARNATTGQLTFVEVQQQGSGTVDGLAGAKSVTVSPDGVHVYVAANTWGWSSDNPGSVAVFARDPATGHLTFVEAEKQGSGNVDGLSGATSVTVSPDGAQVYVAAGYYDYGSVVVFVRNPATGALIFEEVERNQHPVGVDGLLGASSVILSPDGAYVFVAGMIDNALAVFGRDPATGHLSFVQVLRDVAGSVAGLTRADSVTLSPDGAHVYVAAGGEGAVAVFARNATGTLIWIEAQKDQVEAPSTVAVTPDGAHLYVRSGDDSLAVLRRDASSGGLTLLQFQREGVGGVDGLLASVEGFDPLFYSSSVTVSPDGANVYVASSKDNAVAVFGRDAATGLLSFLEAQKQGSGNVDGLAGATSVAVSPDAAHVYVGSTSGSVVVFGRNVANGHLTFVEVQNLGVSTATESVAVSPDGAHVYAARSSQGVPGVAVFGRDAASGRLTSIEVQPLPVNFFPTSLTVSPDGAHVYLSSFTGSNPVVLGRDPATGHLTFVEAQTGSVDARSVTVSPDGAHVYVAASGNTVYARNAATGRLTFIEALQNGVVGVTGLTDALSVTVSPEGAHVYVTGQADNAVAVFRVIRCGDGFTDRTEQCDDGNHTNGDGCDDDIANHGNCTQTACGNGVQTVGEACDEGNTDNTDTCIITNSGGPAGPANCVSARCGDGFTCSAAGCQSGPNNGPEGCDDQNTTSGDGCSSTCAVENGWYCAGTPSACAAKCGDGIVAGAEQCDDGNTASGDGCSSTCTIEHGWYCAGMPSVCTTQCGDGIPAGTEQCDDGNARNGDGCASNCTTEHGWYCSGTPSACSTQCGDGIVAGTERCDDGNTASGDGCSLSCSIETGWSCSTPGIPCAPICGDGITVGPEECDDGNQVDGDGCDSNCTHTGCGNGIVTAGEACDDGICLGGPNNGKHCAANAGCPGGMCERDPNFTKNSGPCVVAGDGQCKNATCGDDDFCTDPRCTTGPKSKPEQCDLGSLNGVPYSGCKSNCAKDLKVPSCTKRLALWSVDSPAPGHKPASRTVVCQDGTACDADHQADGKCEFPVNLCLLVQSKPDACNPKAIHSVEFLGPDTRQCWQAQAATTLATEVSNLAPASATVFGRCRNGSNYGRECTVGDNTGCDTRAGKGDGVCVPGVLFDNLLTLPPGNQKDLCISDTNAKTIAVPAGRRLSLHSQVPGYLSMNALGVGSTGITLVCRPAEAAPTATVGRCVPTPTPTP